MGGERIESLEGLEPALFRIAFERRKTFDSSRPSARPWLYGIGSNLLLKHRDDTARRCAHILGLGRSRCSQSRLRARRYDASDMKASSQ